MVNGDKIKKVIDDIQTIERLQSDLSGSVKSIRVHVTTTGSDASAIYIPDDVQHEFHQALSTAVTKALAQLDKQFRELTKEPAKV